MRSSIVPGAGHAVDESGTSIDGLEACCSIGTPWSGGDVIITVFQEEKEA
jgi:hypothetical protein